MTVKLLLDAKREGRELDSADIRELIAAYTRGDVPDYQMASFAMAVCCKGMTPAETHALTDAMRVSGVCLDWSKGLTPSDNKGLTPSDSKGLTPTADKHSTGGVGDKLSLIIQPLAAACNLRVPSLAGRGLGLTGGTVDKLESIPGYNASLSIGEFQRVVNTCGVSIAAQTAEIAPADKKLYALRDVTGTVPSIPLIVASILSKKLAEGADTLVFDVKCGKGAFMQTLPEAEALANALVDGAKIAGRKSSALVTAMDEPLGCAVGNALEVDEALSVLEGGVRNEAQPSQYGDVAELSIEFAARMVSLARDIPLDDARGECRARLADGSAAAKFAEMVALHGGDLDAFRRRPKARHIIEVSARHSGHVAAIDAAAVARAAFALGAGRAKATDAIDFEAGVVLAVSHGDRVEVGKPLAYIHANERKEAIDAAVADVYDAIAIADATPPMRQRLILRQFP